MIDKPQWVIEEALSVYGRLADLLKPCCERLEVAGSVRRDKHMVGDLEMLFVPKMDSRQADMFSTEPVDLAHERLNELLREGVLEKRPSKTGKFAWGVSNKLAIHSETGLPVDFFSVPPANWWVSLMVRTGPKEWNLRLTKGAQKLGRTLNAYGCGVTVIETGEVIAATSEEQVAELCGVKYLPPELRK